MSDTKPTKPIIRNPLSQFAFVDGARKALEAAGLTPALKVAYLELLREWDQSWKQAASALGSLRRLTGLAQDGDWMAPEALCRAGGEAQAARARANVIDEMFKTMISGLGTAVAEPILRSHHAWTQGEV